MSLFLSGRNFCLNVHFVWYQKSHSSSLLVAVCIRYFFSSFYFQSNCIFEFFFNSLLQSLTFDWIVSSICILCNIIFTYNVIIVIMNLHLPFYLFLYVSCFLLYSSFTIIALSILHASILTFLMISYYFLSYLLSGCSTAHHIHLTRNSFRFILTSVSYRNITPILLDCLSPFSAARLLYILHL